LPAILTSKSAALLKLLQNNFSPKQGQSGQECPVTAG
jgi:hypothetical protein